MEKHGWNRICKTIYYSSYYKRLFSIKTCCILVFNTQLMELIGLPYLMTMGVSWYFMGM